MKPLVVFNRRSYTSLDRPAHKPMRGDLRAHPLPRIRHPRVVVRADGRGIPLEGMWEGGHCFLICGGPSLKELDLTELSHRGLASMALNNAWIMHKPTFWVAADPPRNFSDVGWRDPSIMKFVPRTHATSKIRTAMGGVKTENGEVAHQMPGTFFFVRNNGFDPKTFLDEEGVSWGTLKNTPDALGITNSRSVMLCAFKLLPWMGFRHIYLLGCDFHMAMGEGPAYAWDEEKDKRGRGGNNRLYSLLTRRLEALKPYLDGRGINVWNCNPTSSLKVFPHLSYGEALARARPEAAWGVTKGWYK